MACNMKKMINTNDEVINISVILKYSTNINSNRRQWQLLLSIQREMTSMKREANEIQCEENNGESLQYVKNNGVIK